MIVEFVLSHLAEIASILGTALLMSILLRTVIVNDHFGKVLLLSFGICLAFVINYYHWERAGVQLCYISIATIIYCFLLGLAMLFFRLFEKFQPAVTMVKKNQLGIFSFLELTQQKMVMLFSLVYILCLGIFFLFSANFNPIFFSYQFYLSVLIIFLSLVFVWILDRVISSCVHKQVIRRKLFHIGPIVICPIVNFIDPNILVIILAAGLLVFFALEVVRYQVFLMRKRIGGSIEEQKGGQKEESNRMMRYLFEFFGWMESFNSREKQFWFTHLFLILSLQLAYNVELIYRLGYTGHVVLCLIAADGMAALIGKEFGRMKIYQGKTVEGFMAFGITLIVGLKVLQFCCQIPSFDLVGTLLIGLVCSCCELLGGDADNLLPLLFFYLLSLRLSPNDLFLQLMS